MEASSPDYPPLLAQSIVYSHSTLDSDLQHCEITDVGCFKPLSLW